MSQLIFDKYFLGECYILESSSFQMSLNYNWLLNFKFQPVCIHLVLKKRLRFSIVFLTLFLVVTPNRNQESKKVSEPSREECFVPERGKFLEKVKTLGFSPFQGYYWNMSSLCPSKYHMTTGDELTYIFLSLDWKNNLISMPQKTNSRITGQGFCSISPFTLLNGTLEWNIFGPIRMLSDIPMENNSVSMIMLCSHLRDFCKLCMYACNLSWKHSFM